MHAAPVLTLKGRNLHIEGTLIMGVVNASPESFSDSNTSFQSQQLLAEDLIANGADIIDVGGQSAITNQPELDAAIEIERVLPIVDWLHRTHPEVLISVDTYKPDVVTAVLEAGASIINDVSGLAYPEVAQLCATHEAALVVMHTAAAPKVRLQDPALYADVTGDVLEFLTQKMAQAEALGLPRESLIIDPGPDFTKTPHQTVQLLRELPKVRALGRPVLLALSRKDFLGAITGKTPRGRDAATHAAIALCTQTPGNIVRVHDVEAARDVIRTVDVLIGRAEIPVDYRLAETLRREPPRQ